MMRYLILLPLLAVCLTACHDSTCQHYQNSRAHHAKACNYDPPKESELVACDQGVSKCTAGDKAILDDVAACLDLIDGCGSAADGGGLFDSPEASCFLKSIAVSSTCRNAAFPVGAGTPDAGPSSPWVATYSGTVTQDATCTNGNHRTQLLFETYALKQDASGTVTFDFSSSCTGLSGNIEFDTATFAEHVCSVPVDDTTQTWKITGTLTTHDGVLDVDLTQVVTYSDHSGSCTGHYTGTLH